MICQSIGRLQKTRTISPMHPPNILAIAAMAIVILASREATGTGNTRIQGELRRRLKAVSRTLPFFLDDPNPKDTTVSPPHYHGEASFTPIGIVYPYAGEVEVTLSINVEGALDQLKGATDDITGYVNKANQDLRDDILQHVVSEDLQPVTQQIVELQQSLQQATSKRGAEGWFGMIISMFFGAKNSADIHTLDHQNNVVYTEVGTNRDYIKELAGDLEGFRAATNRKAKAQELQQRVKWFTAQAKSQLETLRGAIYNAAMGKLTPALYSMKQLQEAHAEATEAARKSNQHLVFSHYLAILGSPNTLQLGSKRLDVTFHIPTIAADGRPMSLYMVNPMEVYVDNNTYKVSKATDFYARDNLGWQISISAGQLSACENKHHIYICHRMRVVRKGTYDCASALWNKEEKIDEWCSVDQEKTYAVSQVSGVGANRFHAHSPAAVMDCPGAGVVQVDWKKPMVREVPANCSVVTEDFKIFPSPDGPLDHRHVRAGFILPNFEAYENETNFKTDKEIQQKIATHYQKMRPRPEFHQSWWWGFAVSAALGLALLLLLAVAAWKLLVCSRSKAAKAALACVEEGVIAAEQHRADKSTSPASPDSGRSTGGSSASPSRGTSAARRHSTGSAAASLALALTGSPRKSPSTASSSANSCSFLSRCAQHQRVLQSMDQE